MKILRVFLKPKADWCDLAVDDITTLEQILASWRSCDFIHDPSRGIVVKWDGFFGAILLPGDPGQPSNSFSSLIPTGKPN